MDVPEILKLPENERFAVRDHLVERTPLPDVQEASRIIEAILEPVYRDRFAAHYLPIIDKEKRAQFKRKF